jgi:hypothetical protein
MTPLRLTRLLAVLNTYLAIQEVGADADAWLDSVPDEYGDWPRYVVKGVLAENDWLSAMGDDERTDAIEAAWREWADVFRQAEVNQ